MFDVLSDIVINPLLKKDDIEREKGVIIEELRMYEDTPMIKIGDVFEELIYEGNSLGWDIGGSEKSVRSINKDDFLRYRSIHYYPENILITVSGGVTINQVEKLAEKYFGELKSNKLNEGIFEEFKFKQKKPQVKLHSKKKEQAHFILGFLGEGRNYPGRFAQTLLATILGEGMSSRLFIEVREKRGLAYTIKSSFDRYQEVGYLGTYAGVDVEKVDEAIKVTLDQHYDISNGKDPISNKEINKAKEYLKGHLALAMEDTKVVCGFFGEQELFSKEILTPEDVFKKIDSVKVEDVYREAKKTFKPERLNLAIIGPYDDDSRFRKLLK